MEADEGEDAECGDQRRGIDENHYPRSEPGGTKQHGEPRTPCAEGGVGVHGQTEKDHCGGHHEEATALKGSRWALLKSPPNLTAGQRTTLAGIAKANGGLYRAYLLKEQLRAIFQAVELADARALLGGWIAWARRCRLEPFVRLAKTIKKYQALILNAVEHGLSNARSEATNTHLRLLTRRAYGYHSPEALIAMADLTRGGLCPPLPGRS